MADEGCSVLLLVLMGCLKVTAVGGGTQEVRDLDALGGGRADRAIVAEDPE